MVKSDKPGKEKKNDSSATKPKKGIFKKMYNFITRNKSDDEEDKKKKEEKRVSLKNINLEKIEKQLKEQDMMEMSKEDSNAKNPIEAVKSEKTSSTSIPQDKLPQTEVIPNIQVTGVQNAEVKASPNKVLKEGPLNNVEFNLNNVDDLQHIKPKDMQIIEISNCWSLLIKNPENIEEIFYKNLVSKEEFFKDPWKVLNNTNLVIRYENHLYTWKAAAPLLMSILAYGEVPDPKVMQPLLTKYEGGFMSYFKRSKPQSLDLLKIDVSKGRKTPKSSNNPAMNEAVNSKDIIAQLEKIENKVMHEEEKKEPIKLPPAKRMSVLFKKTFIPASDQLKKLGLKFGRNEIRFTVTSRYQGTHSLVTDLYLWESDSKIVISDVDGTITRSDVLGQLMPIFGKDWSHTGVTELFKNIEKNNYKILYLTARAIGQSEQTKDYLRKLSQGLLLVITKVV